MKKFFLMLAIAGLSMNAMAQEDPTLKYSVATNSFWSNWFIQANVNYSASWAGTDKIFQNPFYKFPLGTALTDVDHDTRTALGFSLAIGKWFTPGLGLRTKATGIWMGKAFNSDIDKYLAVNENVLFNLSNMFCGYNENRIWNFIPYLGAGVARNFDAKANTFLVNAGILNTFRLSKKLAANLELGYTSYGEAFGAPAHDGIAPKHRMNQFSVEVGLTYNLGKTGWSKTPDVDAIKALSQGQIDALNAQLSDAQAENARLKNMLANQPKQTAAAVVAAPQTITKVVAAPVSVFFNLGKSTVASKKDLQNVSDLAKVAKDNNSKLVVTGYADSKTGSADYNQKLSQKRAEAVANELVKLGVSRDQIETVAAGGVNTLSPITYNRRATVEIK
ncbi:MAG: OmpA family protein [Prevotella sp.]|jgi:outer membrane protein OmpA-like peptidoglycan-associated protein|nr:OmpA family protein [Prevotella sp.]